MKKHKQALAILLVTALLTGSFYVPSFAAQAGQVSDEVREAAAEETLEGSSAGYSSVEGTQDGSTEEADAGEDDPDASAADTTEQNETEDEEAADPGVESSSGGTSAAVEEGEVETPAAEEKDAADPFADPSGSEGSEEEGYEEEPAFEENDENGSSENSSSANSSSANSSSIEETDGTDTDRSSAGDGEEAPDDGARTPGEEDPASGADAPGAAETGDPALTDTLPDEAVSTEAMDAALLDGETAISAQTLSEDLTINGDAVFDGGFLDLNGHSLTVTGSLVQPTGTLLVNGGALVVGGDYRIQSRTIRTDSGTGEVTVTYSAANGVLAMHDDDDYVRVEGDFYTGADPDYVNKDGERISETFTAGTFEIGGDFRQTDSGELSVRAGGTHRFLLNKEKAHTVSFVNAECRMAVLEAEEGAETSWEGYFNVARLGSDVTIQTPAGEGEGITIRSEDARLDFYGHDLTVEGNIKSIRGKLYIGGASLAGDEATGSDRPADRGSLTVKGNLLQPEGAVVVDGGQLTVTGDYRIQSRNSNGAYSVANGVLAMHDDDDYVRVEGDFYTGADPDYVNKGGDRISETFTAGTFEIGGDFRQTESGEVSVRAGGTHRFLLNKERAHTVSFANAECRMAVLEAEAGAETSWEGYFNVARLGSDVTIQAPAGEGEGITIRSEDARMDFYGHDLTV
ncbi:MAG: hypothetical protein IKD92_02495, partial [Lachnospiraceae bacterium]|nr:hypothetical protein [Lachnospiraceae bacterium]